MGIGFAIIIAALIVCMFIGHWKKKEREQKKGEKDENAEGIHSSKTEEIDKTENTTDSGKKRNDNEWTSAKNNWKLYRNKIKAH